ncbi:hypothetical protein A0H81_03077 [Grifola frondosa]|uniref:Hyaluronan/mRNA-binding protein domain-containing protein n=1 Tax=Grifola frondosa TaxID=5627 RepID=A0A1C7MJZ3_GRIFR|nr:hypothetical protein A0H81_03077 [Grifola frondosa]
MHDGEDLPNRNIGNFQRIPTLPRIGHLDLDYSDTPGPTAVPNAEDCIPAQKDVKTRNGSKWLEANAKRLLCEGHASESLNGSGAALTHYISLPQPSIPHSHTHSSHTNIYNHSLLRCHNPNHDSYCPCILPPRHHQGPRGIQDWHGQAYPKNGAGPHNWGSLADERELEDAAEFDEEVDVEEVAGVRSESEPRPAPVERRASSVTEEDRQNAREFRKKALKSGEIDLSAIARTSSAVSTSPPISIPVMSDADTSSTKSL